MSNTMKSWELANFGVENLELVRREIPTPGPGEILVKVRAVALNYRDKMVVANGMGAALTGPFTPGSDMAGEVVALGPQVSRFTVGQAVISTFFAGWIDGVAPANALALGGVQGPGVFAEYVLLKEDWVVAAPSSLSAAEASTLPCAGLTAWFALVEQGALHAGQTVLVQGTGGVALFGLQLARAHGAEVIVTSGSDDKLARAIELGAAHGINRHRTPKWAETALALTGGRGVDHVLELAGGDSLEQSLNAVAPGGRVSMIGVLDGFEIRSSVFPLLLRRSVVQGVGVGHRRALEDLVRAVDQNGVKPVIEREYAFTDLPAALAHLERGAFGKLVLVA